MAEVWIGLFEVVPRPGTDYHGAGAYVQIAAPAASESDYISRAQAALAEVGFDAVEWEDVYPLGPGWPPADADASFVQAVKEAVAQDDVTWGDWHSFPRDDESE